MNLRLAKGRERKSMQVSVQEIKIQSVREDSFEDTLTTSYQQEPVKDYHQVDALSQLKANVTKITELQFRLNYMMSELQTLVSKK